MSDIGYDGGLTCSIGVNDIKASMNWYQEVLGFKLLYLMEEMAWGELESPVQRVNVGLSQVEEPRGKGGATLVFGVKDIDSARKNLEEKGVKFDGETYTIEGMVRLATFFDPDDNTFMFYQSLTTN